MRVLQFNNMGSALHLPQVARNHYVGILGCEGVEQVWVIRDEAGIIEKRVRFVTLPWVVRWSFWTRNIWRLWQGVRVAALRRADVVHGVHLWPHGVLAVATGKLLGKPSVVSLVAGAREADLYRGGVGAAGRWALRHASMVTTTGSHSLNELINKHVVAAERACVLPNVIDTASFQKWSDLGFDDREYDIVCTSRFYPVKNVQTIVDVVDLVCRELGPLRVVWCGEGPEFADTVTYARRKGVANCIDFLGGVPHERIVEIVGNSRSFILTSKAEGFPMGLLEALAAGVPCVAPAVGDIPDLIENGLTGYLVPRPDDVEGYARGLVSLLTDRDAWHRMSRASADQAKTFAFSASTVLWEEILQRVGLSGDTRS